MLYVFDTSSIIAMSYYFPERFPSFWSNLNNAVANGDIISTREVLRELDGNGNEYIRAWVKNNKHIFLKPTSAETSFVRKIFSIAHFMNLIPKKQILKGRPVADPFVVASAKVKDGTVVTEELWKPNAAKIPNICKRFSVKCTNLEGFMAAEGWVF